MTRPAVFLDRDGVINRSFLKNGKPYPPSSSEELEILPGVAEALQSLKQQGYFLVVVTNQPDVSRGTTPRSVIDQLNGILLDQLPLDKILTCFHDDRDNCDCRKPKPGLLIQAAREFSLDLSLSFMVGDRWRDIEAGKSAGCQTFFIDYGYDEKQPTEYNYKVQSLTEVAEIILKKGTQL